MCAVADVAVLAKTVVGGSILSAGAVFGAGAGRVNGTAMTPLGVLDAVFDFRVVLECIVSCIEACDPI